MDDQQRLSIFVAQTQNVRELKRAWNHVNREINSSLVQNNLSAVAVHTKVLAVIYCALAETIFSKMIHTPHGLTLDEIEQVKVVTHNSGVKPGWTKCAQLAMRRVDGTSSSHVPNVLRKLEALIDEYIFDPSLIRNKLAHGQWSVALNRENTDINQEFTRQIKDCSVIDLYRRESSLSRLAAILEDMIESPNRAHRRDYWTHLTDLEEGERERAGWTLENKVAQLQKKKSYSSQATRRP